MTATSNDSSAAIAEDLAALYFALPGLVVRPTHKHAVGLAHGWFMCVQRGCGAVLVLNDNGFAAESWPIRRSVLEHVVALKWLAVEGSSITDTVVRNLGNQAASRKLAVQAAGWTTADMAVFDAVIADGLAAQEDKEQDTFLAFKHRCDNYGDAEDWSSWLIESAHSHPGWETASPYLEAGPPSTMLAEPDPVDRDDEGWCVLMLWQALSAMNSFMADPPWDAELASARERFLALP